MPFACPVRAPVRGEVHPFQEREIVLHHPQRLGAPEVGVVLVAVHPAKGDGLAVEQDVLLGGREVANVLCTHVPAPVGGLIVISASLYRRDDPYR